MSPLLEVSNLGKSFFGVPAVRDVSFRLEGGETLALVGENGAGKSTLMKVLAGVHPHGSYDGQIALDGHPVAFRNVREAEQAGIVLVPQELHIAPSLSIAENMFMGRLPGPGPFFDRTELHRRAEERLTFFGVDADPGAPAGVLSPSAQRLVTIASALSKSAAKVLILDEPTASLTESEARHLFDRMEQVRRDGVACIYITHRLDELEGLVDRAIVLRNGAQVASFDGDGLDRPSIVRAMIGHDPAGRDGNAARSRGPLVMEVRGLTARDPFDTARAVADDVSFDLHRGEILGLFGLVGAGRTEMAKSLFGAWKGETSGSMTLAGTEGLPGSPAEAIGRGLAMMTEDRKQTGLISQQSVSHNVSAASLSAMSTAGVIALGREAARNRELVERLDLRPPRLEAKVETFSGGNQQKILLSRWVACGPEVLIVDEPTYGVDIGAREEMYRLLREIADGGCGILMISSDMNEILAECDRSLVMYKGRIRGKFGPNATRQQLMSAATGEG